MTTDSSVRALRAAKPSSDPDEIGRYDIVRAEILSSGVPPADPPRRTRRYAVSIAGATGLVASGLAIGLVVTGASPPNAFAAAERALTVTTSASSGTMTGTVSHDGSSYTLDTTEWNGSNIAYIPGERSELPPSEKELLVVGGNVFVEGSDGSWVQYEGTGSVGPKLGPVLQLAEANVTGTTADDILSLATGLEETTGADGTTVYTGTIADEAGDAGAQPTDDALMRILEDVRVGNEPGAPGGFHPDLQFQMTAGSDGLVQSMSITFRQQQTGSASGDGLYTWTTSYSGLGSTPPITAPSNSTPAPEDTTTTLPAAASGTSGP